MSALVQEVPERARSGSSFSSALPFFYGSPSPFLSARKNLHIRINLTQICTERVVIKGVVLNNSKYKIRLKPRRPFAEYIALLAANMMY